MLLPCERSLQTLTHIALSVWIPPPLHCLCVLLVWCSGLAGWQWLFLLEGVPSVLLGLLVMACVPERPEAAAWLSDSEKALLMQDVSRAERQGWKGRAAVCTAAAAAEACGLCGGAGGTDGVHMNNDSSSTAEMSG